MIGAVVPVMHKSAVLREQEITADRQETDKNDIGRGTKKASFSGVFFLYHIGLLEVFNHVFRLVAPDQPSLPTK